eukprot:INCI10919.1.p1 GENE.INCI10919.1~~INCI10919.1.p1  ORF type:complete len:435 (-),score=62.05 INCI10919.1:108-1412(-)
MPEDSAHAQPLHAASEEGVAAIIDAEEAEQEGSEALYEESLCCGDLEALKSQVNALLQQGGDGSNLKDRALQAARQYGSLVCKARQARQKLSLFAACWANLESAKSLKCTPHAEALPLQVAACVTRFLTGVELFQMPPAPSFSAVCLANRSFALYTSGEFDDALQAANRACSACPWYWKGYLRASRARRRIESNSSTQKNGCAEGVSNVRGESPGPAKRNRVLRQIDFSGFVWPGIGLFSAGEIDYTTFTKHVQATRRRAFLHSCIARCVRTFCLHVSLVPFHKSQWLAIDVSAISFPKGLEMSARGSQHTERFRCFNLVCLRQGEASALNGLANLDYEELLAQSRSAMQDLEALEDARSIVESAAKEILSACPAAKLQLVTLGQGLFSLVEEFEQCPMIISGNSPNSLPVSARQIAGVVFHADTGYMMRSLRI